MNKRLFAVIGTLALGAVWSVQAGNCGTARALKAKSKVATALVSAYPTHKANPTSDTTNLKDELEQLRQTIAEEHKQAQERLDAAQRQNLQITTQLGLQLKVTQDKLAAAKLQLDRLTGGEDQQITKLQSAVESIKSAGLTTSIYVDQTKKLLPERDHPLALHYKGINITPGGYFAAEDLYRSHAENADINTSWSGVPFDSQTMANLSEFRATSRQTRLSLRTDGPIGSATMTGYFETDFLGTGYGASEVQSNGYSNRIRQLWGRVQFPNGWTISAGQMWSLITTNRAGIENLAEFATPLVDASQFVGNDYARQTAIRITKRFEASKVTVAFAAENSATVGVTPANVPTSVSSLISGLSTTGSGALSNTTYSTNVAPDIIAKVAFDPKFGHFEIKAIGRTFRDRLNSTPAVAATSTTLAIPATPGTNNVLLGGAIGGAAYFPVFTKRVNYVAEGMWGAIGRYGATSTDVVVKPNGELSVEKSIHALTGLETHPSPRLDWYEYVSVEYLPRNYGYGLKTIDNTKCFVETGFSCSASTRNLEGNATGVWYRFYKGPSGTVQFGADYVYIVKNTWYGKGGAPRGIENVVETSFRYYLP